MRWILSILIFLGISGVAGADPFIKSTNSYTTSVTQPTHCYIYLDGETTASLQSPVSKLGNGTVFCEVDIGPMTVGIHTATITAVIETAGVVTEETAKFTMPKISKEACTDAKLCIFKYQMGDTIYWYK